MFNNEGTKLFAWQNYLIYITFWYFLSLYFSPWPLAKSNGCGFLCCVYICVYYYLTTRYTIITKHVSFLHFYISVGKYFVTLFITISTGCQYKNSHNLHHSDFVEIQFKSFWKSILLTFLNIHSLFNSYFCLFCFLLEFVINLWPGLADIR